MLLFWKYKTENESILEWNLYYGKLTLDNIWENWSRQENNVFSKKKKENYEKKLGKKVNYEIYYCSYLLHLNKLFVSGNDKEF